MKTKDVISSHTPGPWKAEKIAGTSRTEYRVSSGVNESWQVVAGPGGGYALPEANARLIAAAPELLSAAHEVLIEMRALRDLAHGHNLLARSGDSANMAGLCAAIAKAEGGK